MKNNLRRRITVKGIALIIILSLFPSLQSFQLAADTYQATTEDFSKTQKASSTETEGGNLKSLETLNDDMRPSPEWMGLEVTDDYFFDWISEVAGSINNDLILNDLNNARQNTGLIGDQPPSFGYYTPEEDSLMWNAYKEWCAPRNEEAKEYFYQQPWVLMLTPQAYQQLQENNPGIDDPAEWKDEKGKPWMEYVQREFRYLEQGYAAAGFNLRIELIPELVIIDDPLADQIDQEENRPTKVNERLRDDLVEPSLKDSNSALSQQLKTIADRYGIPLQQLQMVTVARYGQSAGETYYTHSNDPNGKCRAFGVNSNAVWGFDYTEQTEALFHVEQMKSTLRASNSGTEAGGKRSWNKSIPELQTELGLPDNWWPVGVEGQPEADNHLLFESVKFGKALVSGTDSNVAAGRLLMPSNPDTTINILWQEWDESSQQYIGEKVVHPVTPGSEFHDVTHMTHWPHQLLIGNVSLEKGLIPQTLSVNLNPSNPISSDIEAAAVEGGYNITVPGNLLLTEANPEITSFLINSESLPDGVQLVSQDGAEATLFVTNETITQLSSFEIVVRGFSTENDRLCTPSTPMQLDLLELDTTPPEVTSEGYSPSGMLEVFTGVNLTIPFDEPMKIGSGTLEIRNANGTPFASFDASEAVIDGNRVSFPTVNFQSESQYTVTYPEGFVTDLSGNPCPAVSGDSWSFETPDVTGPEIIENGLSPMGELAEDGTAFDLTMEFNENIVMGTGIVQIYNKSTNQLFQQHSVNDINIEGKKATLPIFNLQTFTEYYILVDEGIFEDEHGKKFSGITNPDTWVFKTKDSNVGIDELEQQGNIDFYPNPSSGVISIKGIENPNNEKICCQFFDASGILVYEEFFNNTENQLVLSPNKKTGIYILKITIGNKISYGKIIRE